MANLSDAYFDGSRLEEFNRLMGGFLSMKEIKVDEMMERFYKGLEEKYARVIGGRELSDRYTIAYREYVRNNEHDFFQFEQKALNIVFYIQRSVYQDILMSTTPERRFLFSSMEYRVCGKFLQYEYWDHQVLVNPSVAEIVPVDCTAAVYDKLVGLGCVRATVPYPEREQIMDGQMKITENLFKAIQTLDRKDNLEILIVGSSSQAMGGGRSYDLLQHMVKDSTIHLYDPHETNETYKAGSVTYNRYAEPFVYSDDVQKYDLVIDDAFIAEGRNREVLDPHKWLFKAKNFSCKFLRGDEKYFKGHHAVKQVGKVASWERRVYKKIPLVGPIRDNRFGSCVFCREMFYYSNHNYDSKFFEVLASIHSPSTKCAIRKRYVAPLCVGDIDYKGRKMYSVLKVENPVCLKFDPVGDYEQIMNFKLTTDRTYVFSDITNIQDYMYAAKVAVYDKELDRFFINYELRDIIDAEGDSEIEGIKFRHLKYTVDDLMEISYNSEESDKVIIKDRNILFKDMYLKGTPLLVHEKIFSEYKVKRIGAVVFDNDSTFMWKVYRFFGRFYYWYIDDDGGPILAVSM